MGATTPATETPMFLSADKRKISYRSKNGNTITLEFKNKNSPAADSLRELSKKNPVQKADISVDETAEGKQNLWLGVYDTLSFWVMEAMEIAAFGPYDDPLNPTNMQTVHPITLQIKDPTLEAAYLDPTSKAQKDIRRRSRRCNNAPSYRIQISPGEA